MLVRGEVKCLHCGFVSGTWVGTRSSTLRPPGFVPAAPGLCEDVPDPLRCLRCRGPVYLESPEPVLPPARLRRITQLREQLDALNFRRSRGRPAA